MSVDESIETSGEFEKAGMLSILVYLYFNEDSTFDDLDSLPIARASISKRLKRLEEMNFVSRRRRGKHVLYSLTTIGITVSKPLIHFVNKSTFYIRNASILNEINQKLIPAFNEKVERFHNIAMMTDNNGKFAKNEHVEPISGVEFSPSLLVKTAHDVKKVSEEVAQQYRNIYDHFSNSPKVSNFLDNFDGLYSEIMDIRGKIIDTIDSF